MTLTQQQKKAIQSIGKNVLVSAGAGTGKTRVLVERILHLLRSQKASLGELLVLTFTEKAAHEIKERLSGSFRDLGLEQPRRDLEKASISTFHGFAAQLLKEHPIEAGVDPDFRVVETEQSELLKEEAMRETFAKLYAEKDGAFECLSAYGEGVASEGVHKVFSAARHEGKRLREFFLESLEKEKEICGSREQALSVEARDLCSKLEEIDRPSWERFLGHKTWDREIFRDFAEWSALYKGKRKAGWKEWRSLLADLAALRLGPLAIPWKEKFESLALAFEAAYGIRKKEKGFLDFDDLQMKAVELFRSKRPELQRLRARYQNSFKFILVDEFQDTNVLQMEFVELLSSGNNLFMVGDYKQSIYGFRGAEPGIFRAREDLYKEGSQGTRIFLAESFRSDPPVLDFVNPFFKELWAEDGFIFEPLLAGPNTYPLPQIENGGRPCHPLKKQMKDKDDCAPDGKTVAQVPAVEVLATELKEDEDMRCARLREAGSIAARVRELHENDKIPYGDMAVLFQAMTLSGIYEDAFKSAGIPYFIVAGRGFYEQPEVQDMMSFLSHLERPLADIPLAATLRSPFFHITDDTLFWLSRYAKAKQEEAPLFQAVKTMACIQEISAEQKTRLGTFLDLTRALSEIKDRIPLSELIDKILEGTGYELSVLMDPKGVRRYANLKKLVAMTREYETFERMPLSSFLNILKRLKAQEVRESEAQTVLEAGEEAVRMMSVHAAKGLEFPVVFIADMGRQGSRPDSKAVIAHAASGYALQIPGGEDSETERPYFFKWVDGEIARRETEEWKRLLYVAVTRAKSRIFLSGVHKKKKEEKESFRDMASWMDWVLAICSDMPGVKVTQDPESIPGSKGRISEGRGSQIEAFVKDVERKGIVPDGSRNPSVGIAFPRSIDLPVSAYVLFQKDPGAFWKTYQVGWSVLGQDLPDRENEWAGEDAIFKEDDLSAADFGTAMHGFLEHWDLQDPESALELQTLQRVFGRFGGNALKNAQKILRDLSGQPVFQELRKARRIQREIDFVLNERHGLIHGKIDLMFEDAKGQWHILDFKTAAGDEASAQKSAYDLQLEIYALAAERILKLPVSSAIIYYLKNQKAVVIPFPSEKTLAIFNGLEKKIRDLQQKILDYSNERMAAACDFKEGS